MMEFCETCGQYIRKKFKRAIAIEEDVDGDNRFCVIDTKYFCTKKCFEEGKKLIIV